MILIILFIILVIGIYKFNPFIDIFQDYRGKFHIVLWYTFKNGRKYINIVGDQN